MDILLLQKRIFAGFLMGEGCFRLAKAIKHRNWATPMYKPCITISLRADDAEILKWAKMQYGGTLIWRNGRPQIPNQNPYYMWILEGAKVCLKVIDDFLQAELPSKKKEQASLLRKICVMKIEKKKNGHKGMQSRWYTDEEIQYQEDSFQRLKQLKLYKV